MSRPAFPPEYPAPDERTPLDLDAHRALIPDEAVLKGMYFNDLRKVMREAGHPSRNTQHYTLFKDYPQRDYFELLVEAAQTVYPDLPLARALREVGRSAYPTLASSTIGRVVFGVLGGNLQAIFRVAKKGYDVSMNLTEVKTLETSPHHAVVQLDRCFVFPHQYQVGVFEGALATAGRDGEVRPLPLSPTSVRLYIVWD